MSLIAQDEGGLLSARETAARLGVKLDTLYAYVSRGRLRSVAVPGSRERGYRPEEVERFRLLRQRGERSGTLSPAIDSAICLIEGGRFYYRGVDAIRLADRASLEDAAALLWEGDAAPSPPIAVAAASAAGLIERCQIRLAVMSAQDLAALDLTRAGVIRTGGRILAALVGCVGDAAPPPAEPTIHRQLAALWRLDDAGADLLRRCLVLLADHELNASAFVARCVASTGATPSAVVAAALAALSGRRHGGAAARAEALFHEIGPGSDPMAVMAARLARDDRLPGLGQPLYPDGDPRALAIIEAIAAARPEAGARIAAAAVAALRLTGEYPNVDFALAAAATALGLPAGGALSLFVVARTVGWIAHAIEQYESALLIRPRARYTGPAPAALRP
jgi:citrate synthase